MKLIERSKLIICAYRNELNRLAAEHRKNGTSYFSEFKNSYDDVLNFELDVTNINVGVLFTYALMAAACRGGCRNASLPLALIDNALLFLSSSDWARFEHILAFCSDFTQADSQNDVLWQMQDISFLLLHSVAIKQLLTDSTRAIVKSNLRRFKPTIDRLAFRTIEHYKDVFLIVNSCRGLLPYMKSDEEKAPVRKKRRSNRITLTSSMTTDDIVNLTNRLNQRYDN